MDELKRLETLALFAATNVRATIQSSMVTQWASRTFDRNRELFAMNPANTLVYSALKALEERSIVHIAELLAAESGLFGPITRHVRSREQIHRHRLALSHTFTIKWRKPEMQAFYDDDRHILDFASAFVWDFQHSVNTRIRALGGEPKYVTVDVSFDMACALQEIFRGSLASHDTTNLPSAEDFFTQLGEYRDKFLESLLNYAEKRHASKK